MDEDAVLGHPEGMNLGDTPMAPDKGSKIVFTFRIDPRIKEAARKAASEARTTLSKYVQNLIRMDLWRKGLLG
jgi:predicted HicB family RNase H-like nuclease